VIAELLPRCRFPDTDALICAVSGGADSLTLLALAAASGRRVEAVHVDHGLRPGSHEEAAVVEHAAISVGAGFRSLRVSVAVGANLEARAREARYKVLPHDVATGHTMDDLAETVVLNMLWGAGLQGLAPFAGSGPPYRPLLDLRRNETQALCAHLGWVPVVDAMNEDTRFRRVRIRHELVPLLDAVAERDVVPIIARQAALIAEEMALLENLARAIEVTDSRALRDAPAPLARRAIRRWLMAEGVGDGHPPPADVVARVLDVARGNGSQADLLGGWRVARTAQRLRVERRPS
jgi:tRNA(Ile)-lysidine synthase